MLRTSDLDYHLPPEAIATRPAQPRDSARLMVVRRAGDRPPEHRVVSDLPEILRRGDLLVLNTTRVLPARLEGERHDTHGHVEGLFLGPAPAAPGGARWVVLLRGKRLRPGVELVLGAPEPARPTRTVRLVEPVADQAGGWVVEVLSADGMGEPDALDQVGRTPLPPYILKARRHAGLGVADSADRVWYQTVFADEPGSVAAPTAGLHFTPELLTALETRGVARAGVVLHVGTGTFRPVETEFVEQHPMHGEFCRVPEDTVGAVAQARARAGRVVAVGTTSARVLESFASSGAAHEYETRLLITPGYPWRVVDGLLTNFHLPRSTLLAMVAALFPGGIEYVKTLYQEAIGRGYRFYSYGDAMLILP